MNYSELFAHLNESDVKYCVLRNYTNFDNTSDIDLLIDDPITVDRNLTKFGYENVLWSEPYLLYRNGKTIDIRAGRTTYLGMCGGTANDILSRRKKYKNFYIPSQEDEYIHLSLHYILNKREIRKKYIIRLDYLLDKIDHNIVCKRFQELCGQSGIKLFDYLSGKNYSKALDMKWELFRSMFSLVYMYEHIQYMANKRLLK